MPTDRASIRVAPCFTRILSLPTVGCQTRVYQVCGAVVCPWVDSSLDILLSSLAPPLPHVSAADADVVHENNECLSCVPDSPTLSAVLSSRAAPTVGISSTPPTTCTASATSTGPSSPRTRESWPSSPWETQQPVSGRLGVVSRPSPPPFFSWLPTLSLPIFLVRALGMTAFSTRSSSFACSDA